MCPALTAFSLSPPLPIIHQVLLILPLPLQASSESTSLLLHFSSGLWQSPLMGLFFHSYSPQLLILFSHSIQSHVWKKADILLSCFCLRPFKGSFIALGVNFKLGSSALCNLPPASLIRSSRHHSLLPLSPAALASSLFLQWTSFSPSLALPHSLFLHLKFAPFPPWQPIFTLQILASALYLSEALHILLQGTSCSRNVITLNLIREVVEHRLQSMGFIAYCIIALIPTFPTCVTSNEFLYHSVPRFPLLQNGCKKSTIPASKVCCV